MIEFRLKRTVYNTIRWGDQYGCTYCEDELLKLYRKLTGSRVRKLPQESIVQTSRRFLKGGIRASYYDHEWTVWKDFIVEIPVHTTLRVFGQNPTNDLCDCPTVDTYNGKSVYIRIKDYE